jgi:hypothetical protein
MMKSLLPIGIVLLICSLLMAYLGETGRIQLIAGGLATIGIVMTLVGFIMRRNVTAKA